MKNNYRWVEAAGNNDLKALKDYYGTKTTEEVLPLMRELQKLLTWNLLLPVQNQRSQRGS